jgi:hypothetical protein
MSVQADSRLIMDKAQIIRYRTLPDDVSGEVLVKVGDTVTAKDVVVLGSRASEYKIVEVGRALGLDPKRQAARLDPILNLPIGTRLAAGDPIGVAGKDRGLARRLPKAPAPAIVSLVEGGRVILQLNPERIEVTARLTGEVIEVEDGYGVAIEALGSLLQVAWGNGQVWAGRFSFEPGKDGTTNQGLESLRGMDVALSPYSNKVIILTRPLRAADLEFIGLHEVRGFVAPCAPVQLRDQLRWQEVPILLTEGFGAKLPPTSRLYDLLAERRSSQAIFDASPPDFHRGTRPEIIIPGGVSHAEAKTPLAASPLAVGQKVRVARPPYLGAVGRITDLPESPLRFDNGLKLLAAQVELPSGESLTVAQANLENLGE